MSKGIIYVMNTAVQGLVKIGRTGSGNFEQRMYELENNGYRNVTSLKRAFAIEVDDYSEKEDLLHTIFEKSQVGNTELFALDVNVAKQLLSSFDGMIVFPKNESKEEVFDEATDMAKGRLVPDGTIYFRRRKKSDNKTVTATVSILNGNWILKKGSILGIVEDVGVSKKTKAFRATLNMTDEGELLEDADLGACSPSFAGEVVMNQSNNGWTDWKTDTGKPIDVYRARENR